MAKYEIKKAAELIEKSKSVLVFTGAGISTSSGIPDFRGTNGIWTKRRPVYYRDFLNSEKAKIDYWDYKIETYEAFKNAAPNPAHLALVELEKSGKLLALITQNIDSLHRKAGTGLPKLIELHGTNALAECLDCSEKVLIDEAMEDFKKTGKPPKCPCGGYLKPAVIMFGESLNPENLKKAFALTVKADLIVSVGSTLTVEPAASIPLMSKEKGVPYIIVNKGPTAHDRFADIKIEIDAARTLPVIVEY